MAPLERKPCAEHVFGQVTSYTRSFSEGSETKVLGVQYEGLPHGEFPEDPGYLGQQVTPPGRQVPECGHRSGIAGRGKRAPAGTSTQPAGHGERRRELERQFSGWEIWYVPRGPDSAIWCARPRMLIDAGSPEDLAAAIRAAHGQVIPRFCAVLPRTP